MASDGRNQMVANEGNKYKFFFFFSLKKRMIVVKKNGIKSLRLCLQSSLSLLLSLFLEIKVQLFSLH
jgi:hypothetical protein